MSRSKQILNRVISKIEEVTESLIPGYEGFKMGSPSLSKTDVYFSVVIDALTWIKLKRLGRWGKVLV